VKPRSAVIGIAAGAAAFGAHLLLGPNSAAAERFYSRGFYVGLRWIWDNSLGRSPIPVLYLMAAVWVAWMTVRMIRRAARPRVAQKIPILRRAGRFLLWAAGWTGVLVFSFYVLWGFNYNRIGLERQMKLEAGPLDPAGLAGEAEWATQAAAEARTQIAGASESALGPDILPARLEAGLRAAMAQVLRSVGYPAPGRVRVRTFVPGGWMMRFSGSGIFIPYCGESYTASALLAFEKPFTMAHEMAHGYGITEEGEASFLALLTCRASADPAVRYAGFMGYWDYAAGELASVSPDRFKALWKTVPEGMKADVRAERANWDRFKSPVEKISRKVYDRYLKAQGIREGMRSYSRFVALTAAWRKRL
jgi:hypothetical protein